VPPELVLEVVIPDGLKREPLLETRPKRSQYQSRNIPIYWIIDPQVQEILVLTLTPTGYKEQVYRGIDRLQFQDTTLNVTAEEILLAG
jgi:Uma2 family endonuclease